MPQSGGNGAATAVANRGGGGGGGSGCKVASLGGKSASLPSHVVDGAPVLDPLGWFLPITVPYLFLGAMSPVLHVEG